MVYRAYRYTKKNEKSSGTIYKLNALNIGDLKKIKKSLENYKEKKEAHNRRILPILEENKRITDVNKKNQKEYDRWLDEFKEKVINKKQKKLELLWDEICLLEVGFFSSFLEKTISVSGKYIPHATGAHLVEQHREIQNQLSMHWKKVSDTHSKLTSLTKRTSHVPSFKYQDPYISINGTRVKLDLTRWTIDEVENIINQKIDLEQEEQEKNQEEKNVLRARAFERETSVRSQSDKYKKQDDFDWQKSRVSCCPYCGENLIKSFSHLDHIYPVKKGGQSIKANLVFVCSDCNLKKSDLTLRNFIKMTKLSEIEIHERLEALNKDF